MSQCSGDRSYHISTYSHVIEESGFAQSQPTALSFQHVMVESFAINFW